MRRPLAALITLTQLHPLIAVALCLGSVVGPAGEGRDCSEEAGHSSGQHAAAAPEQSPQATVGASSGDSESEGCPVATSCAPLPVAPYPSAAHTAGSTPDGVPIAVPVEIVASLSQFPPPTPPPNS